MEATQSVQRPLLSSGDTDNENGSRNVSEAGRTLAERLRSHPLIAYLLVMLACFTMTFAGVLIKLMVTVDPFVLTAYRNCVVFLCSVPRLVNRRIDPVSEDRSKLKYLLARAVLSSVYTMSLFYSFRHLPLGDARTITSTHPIFVSLFAWCVLREPCGLFDVLMLVSTTTGMVVVMHPPFLFGQEGQEDAYAGYSRQYVLCRRDLRRRRHRLPGGRLRGNQGHQGRRRGRRDGVERPRGDSAAARDVARPRHLRVSLADEQHAARVADRIPKFHRTDPNDFGAPVGRRRHGVPREEGGRHPGRVSRSNSVLRRGTDNAINLRMLNSFLFQYPDLVGALGAVLIVASVLASGARKVVRQRVRNPLLRLMFCLGSALDTESTFAADSPECINTRA